MYTRGCAGGYLAGQYGAGDLAGEQRLSEYAPAPHGKNLSQRPVRCHPHSHASHARGCTCRLRASCSTAAAAASRRDLKAERRLRVRLLSAGVRSGGIRAWYFECENTCVYHGVSHDDWCDPSMFVCSGTLEKVSETGTKLISSGASPSLPPAACTLVRTLDGRVVTSPR